MPTQNPKLQKLQDLFKIVNEGLSRDEFTNAFSAVLKIVKDIKASNVAEFAAINKEIRVLSKQVTDDTAKEVESFKGRTLELITAALKEQENGMKFIYDKVRNLKQAKDGKDGVDGKDAPPADESKIVDSVLAKLPPPSNEIPEETKQKLESMAEEIRQLKARPTSFGARGIGLYINGVKKLLSAQTLNITGSGVSYNYANGRNDVTITGSGGGSLSVLAATGTVDDSNTTFTFASTPTLVMVNGAAYRDGHGVTIVTTTATLDNPPGVGGDVYGLG